MFKRILGIGAVVLAAAIGLSGCGKTTTTSSSVNPSKAAQPVKMSLATAAQSKTPRVWYAINESPISINGSEAKMNFVRGIYITKNSQAISYTFDIDGARLSRFSGKSVSQIQAIAEKLDRKLFEANLDSEKQSVVNPTAKKVYRAGKYIAPSWRPIDLRVVNATKAQPAKKETIYTENMILQKENGRPVVERSNTRWLDGVTTGTSGFPVFLKKAGKKTLRIDNTRYVHYSMELESASGQLTLISKAPSSNTKLQFDKLGTHGVTKTRNTED
ncbi:hypothetical protein DA798_09130 [Lactobacillus sp. PFC-70]|nr:hypothetical protein DA798_09130 [Lactobacillus sp. PFC-70]